MNKFKVWHNKEKRWLTGCLINSVGTRVLRPKAYHEPSRTLADDGRSAGRVACQRIVLREGQFDE